MSAKTFTFPTTQFPWKMVRDNHRDATFAAEEVAAACDACVAGGREPLDNVLFFEPQLRAAGKVRYGDVGIILNRGQPDEKIGCANIVVEDAVHRGGITPTRAADIAEFNKRNAEKGWHQLDGPRDKDAAFTIGLYNCDLPKDPDTNVETGELPPDSEKTPYMLYSLHYNRAFLMDQRRRRGAGKAVLALYQEDPVANRELIETYIANGAYVSREDYEDAMMPSCPRGLLILAVTRLFPVVQEKVSLAAKKNPGSDLLNPLTRAKFLFDRRGDGEIARTKKGNVPRAEYFDEEKQYFDADDVDQEVPLFEPLRFEGKAVNDGTAHLMVKGTKGSMLIPESICYSQSGCSAPRKITYGVFKIKKFERVVRTATSLFGKKFAKPKLPKAAPAPVEEKTADADAGGAPAAAAGDPAIPEIGEDDLDDLINAATE